MWFVEPQCQYWSSSSTVFVNFLSLTNAIRTIQKQTDDEGSCFVYLLPPRELDLISAKFPQAFLLTHFFDTLFWHNFWHTFLTQSFQYVTMCRDSPRKAPKLLSMHWTNFKTRTWWNQEMIKKRRQVFFSNPCWFGLFLERRKARVVSICSR